MTFGRRGSSAIAKQVKGAAGILSRCTDQRINGWQGERDEEREMGQAQIIAQNELLQRMKSEVTRITTATDNLMVTLYEKLLSLTN